MRTAVMVARLHPPARFPTRAAFFSETRSLVRRAGMTASVFSIESNRHVQRETMIKADAADFLGRFREIVSDPLNMLIERCPAAGLVEDDLVVLHNGNKVARAGPLAYYGDFCNILVINRGVHEPLEEYVFQTLLKSLGEKPLMIELGAYWAHYSMWLMRERPLAQTILIEPDASCLAAGRANFERKGFRGEFIQDFVARGLLIDPFLAARGISHLDVLHSDIQGYEVEMLAGAKDALRDRRIDFVFVSTHSQDGHESICATLREAGYRIEVTSDFDNETTSFDGLVFASSPNVARLFSEFHHFGRQKISSANAADLVSALNHRASMDGRAPSSPRAET